MAYSVRHITNFKYEPEVRELVMEVRMQPRSEGRQRCLTFALEVNPQANIMYYRDFLRNTVHHFDIPGRQNRVRISAQAIVEVEAPPPLDGQDPVDWESLDAHVAAGDYLDMLLPSRYAKATDHLRELAEELHVKRRGTPLEMLLELNNCIYHVFEYAPNSTQVDSPIDDALRSRKGVCQDFAHVMIALVRRLGIPCRYVSGYLYHDHSDKTHDRSEEGASHAWIEAYLPNLGWIGFDPTNNLIGGERHIRVAVGRDYADVPPTRGVYKGDVEGELAVQVSVTPVDSPAPEELRPATVIRRPRTFDPAQALQLAQEQQQQQ
jgi:transglutaminase-like putative cysteine protease